MRAVIFVSVLMLGILSFAGTASAAPTNWETCSGTIDGGEHPNIVVPVGATCFLYNATVNGNVLVQEDGKAIMYNDRIAGSVKSQGGEEIQLAWGTIVEGDVTISGGETNDGTPYSWDFYLGCSTVYGNVTIKGMAGDIVIQPASTCGPAHIDGNLTLDGNPARLFLQNTAIDGNVTVKNNTGSEKYVRYNTVGGSLSCQKNSSPFEGVPNTVSGKASGQCYQ